MTIIQINFKPEKFQEEVEKLEKKITDSIHVSLNLNNRDEHSIILYIGGTVTMIFSDYTEEEIYLSIHSDMAFYDREEQNVKHIDESIRVKGIRRYIIT